MKLLKATEVAERLNCGVSTVYALVNTGELKAVRFNKSVRVEEKDLEAWIEERKKG